MKCRLYDLMLEISFSQKKILPDLSRLKNLLSNQEEFFERAEKNYLIGLPNLLFIKTPICLLTL